MENQSPFRFIGPGKQESKPSVEKKSGYRLLRSWPLVSVFILAGIIFGCAAAGLMANHDPAHFYLDHLGEAPGMTFYFGTDSLGRDIYSSIWYGGRRSLCIGFIGMAVSSVVGILYGCLSGIAPSQLDMLFMRMAELLSSIPAILLDMVLLACISTPDVVSVAVVIGVTSWMNLARMVRNEVRKIRNSDYVLASRCMGGGFLHILRWHLVPNFLPSVMFMIISSIGSAILMESTLSFLGLGLPVESISWGSMLSLSQRALLTNSWWVILMPGLFIISTLLCITNIGHYLRRTADRNESNL